MFVFVQKHSVEKAPSVSYGFCSFLFPSLRDDGRVLLALLLNSLPCFLRVTLRFIFH